MSTTGESMLQVGLCGKKSKYGAAMPGTPPPFGEDIPSHGLRANNISRSMHVNLVSTMSSEWFALICAENKHAFDNTCESHLL